MRTLEQRARRSTVNWFDILPLGVAKSQVAFEKARTASAARAAGVSIKDISAGMGVSSQRLYQLIEENKNRSSPAERYLTVQQWAPLARDAAFVKLAGMVTPQIKKVPPQKAEPYKIAWVVVSDYGENNYSKPHAVFTRKMAANACVKRLQRKNTDKVVAISYNLEEPEKGAFI